MEEKKNEWIEPGKGQEIGEKVIQNEESNSLEKERDAKNKQRKKKAKRGKTRRSKEEIVKNVKNGSYSIAVTAAVIGIVVIVNLILGELPVNYTQIDMTEQRLYSIGSQTKEILEKLDEDITIYVLAEEGQGDEAIAHLLEQYTGNSRRISVVYKDPVLYPNFYSAYSDESLSEGSIIVAGENRSKVIDYNDLYELEYDYYSYNATATGFDGEGKITSGIAYVLMEDVPVMYTLSGHGEAALNSSLQKSVDKENIEVESLNLLTLEAVPEDAACLLLNAPTSDISETEAGMIRTYLESGGRALIFTGYTGETMPNLYGILNAYGVKPMEGILVEGNTNYCVSQSPLYLLPDVNSTSASSNSYSSGKRILMPVAQGIEKLNDVRDTLSISSILTTSDDAYCKTDMESSVAYEKESSDISGPFDLGVAISEQISSDEEEDNTGDNTDGSLETESADAGGVKQTEEATEGNSEDAEEETAETRLVYFSSPYMLEDQIDSAVSGGNSELVMEAVSWIVDHDVTVSIPVKSMEVSYLTFSARESNTISAVVTIVIPLALLTAGGVIWMKRRKL